MPKIDSHSDKPTFLNTIDFSVQNVHKIPLSLKPTLSSGPGGIPNIVLRKLASHSFLVTSGVPQGSVLGLTIFLLYPINDLADCFDNLQCTVFSEC